MESGSEVSMFGDEVENLHRRYLAKKRTIWYQVSRSKHFDIKSSNLYLDGIVSVEGRLQVSAVRIRVPFVLRITNSKFSIRASKPRNIRLAAKFLVVAIQKRQSHLRLSNGPRISLLRFQLKP
jgi:hypothetical protein